MTATWLGDVLRAAGLKVVEHDGWKTRSHGEFTDLHAVVWHHDGSPVGDSPGVPAYMIRNWNTASANCWVALDGTWHLIGAGVAYHAGTVLPGKPGNHSSIGVETDHTTGETWSGVHLLDSLRRGTAAILRHLQTTTGGLEFHKTICSPPGRKNDPDGLDLTTERAAVAALLHQEDDEMTQDEHDAVMTANHFVKVLLPPLQQQVDEIHAALFQGAPGYGVAPMRDTVNLMGYNLAGLDLPNKPSTIRKILTKLGIG